MEKRLLLKFGACIAVYFKDEAQKKLFLETHCYKSRNGQVYLHHGINLHDFTPLSPDCYKDIPKGVKMKKARKDFYLFAGYTKEELIIKREIEHAKDND